MRAVQILADLATEASGPSYSVPRLAQSLAALNVQSEIYVTGRTSSAGVSAFPLTLKVLPLASRLRFSRGLRIAIERAADAGAVLHSHGLWLMPNLYPAWAARRTGSPLIVSPRGMLAPAALSFSRTQKRLFWMVAQRRALEMASCFHATSNEEAQDIRRAGFKAPIVLIPNGIDVPPAATLKPKNTPPTVLHLGRLHPKKGTDRLLDAWARLETSFPEWRLRIVGPSENGYAEALQSKARLLGLARVSFEGPLFGGAKTEAYSSAEIFVLPTLNENFGLVVAEALAAGTLVICSKGAPWAALTTTGSGYWVDHGPEALAAALYGAMSASADERAAMGLRGRDWMAREFSWRGVAEAMLSVYRWMNGQGGPPTCLIET